MIALLVGLDDDLAAGVRDALRAEWRNVEVVSVSDQEAAAEALARGPDIIFVNGCAAPIDGVELAARLRAETEAPIVLLCDRARPFDRVSGLRRGVDDYLSLPISTSDLRKRVRAALRLRRGELPATQHPAFEAGSLRIDYAARSVTVSGGGVRLSPAEYGILYHLTRSPDRVLTYRTLLAKVWGRAYVEEVDYLKVQVEQLRAKLRGVVPPAVRIANRRGIGYALVLAREGGGADEDVDSAGRNTAAASS
jgi:DNA-binding response OmpR family regulator